MKLTADDLESVNPYLFIKGQNIKDEKGIPLSFRDRPFLVKPLCDMSPLQAWLKAPQIGATVTMTIKAFHTAKNYNKDIIYTLPTQSDVYDMAGGKINRIVAQNKVFKEWIKNHDTVEQKNVGDNIIYYRGTFTTKQAMMVSSQVNIHDEVDASNPEVITQYETRQQAEAGGMRWYLSHPSIVGAGIDKFWQVSDQQEWFIKCNVCGEEQFMEWPLSVDQVRQCYQCKYCNAIVTDEQRRQGVSGMDSWRRKYPNAEFVGYHMSQLICPWIPASKIIKDFKEKEPQYFHNFCLALPYADSKSKVTLETIKGLLTNETQRKGRILFGVDTGVKIRWTCGDMNGLIDMGEVDTYEDLQRVCDKYKDWVMVIDQGGDIIGARQFAETNAGKVFLCFFQQDKKSMQLVKWGEGEEYGRVMVDRNRLIQLVVDEMNDKRIPLMGVLEKWWNMWLHWSHMYRIVDEDRMGNLVYVWERSDRNDWALAMCYYRVAIERFASNESEFVGGEKSNDGIEEAPSRSVDGSMPMFKLTMPELNNKSDDWRYN